jgi:CHAT domain-containing protein/Flp pilus assembly protein TadD
VVPAKSLVLAVLVAASQAGADVVVLEARRGGEAAKAGLRPGDKLVSWRRAATRSAPSAAGAFRAPWDVDEVELGEVPRGPVRVVYVRRLKRAEARLGGGEWRLKTRPEAEGEMALWQTMDRASDLTAKGRYADARVDWDAAKEVARRRGDDRLVALVLRLELRALGPLQDMKALDAALRDALAIRARLDPGGPLEALSTSGLALFLGNFRGQEKEGQELVGKALAMIEKSAPGSLAHARILMNAGGLATRREDLDEGRRLLTKALAIASRLAPDGDAAESCYNALGQIARNRGDFAVAEADQRRALDIALARDPEGVSAAGIWNSLGVIRKQRGDLAGAEEAYGKAAALYERAAPGSMNVAGVTSNLGNIALERGEFATAEERHRKALSIREALAPEGRDVAASLADLARVALLKRDLDEAESLAARSLALSRKLSPGGLAEGAALSRLAEVEAARGGWPAAGEHLRAALAIGVRLAPRSLATASTRRSLAEALLAEGRTAEAVSLAKESVDVQRRIAPGTTSVALAWDTLAKGLAAGGDDPGAEEAFEAGLDALEEQADRLGVSYEGASAYSSFTSDVYRDFVDVLVARGRGADALRVLERSRARRLLSMLKARDAVAGRLPEALATRRAALLASGAETERSLASLDPEKDAAKLEAAQAKLRELRSARAALVSELAASDPLFAAALHPRPLEAAEIRKALDPGTLFLAFAAGPERTLLLVLKAGETADAPVEAHTLAAGADDLRREVEIFRSLLAGGEENAGRARVQARQLGDLLLGGVAASLASAERLLIAPDGPLLTLPFGALVAPGGDGWLAGRLPFVVAPSATAFFEMRRPAPAKGPARLVVFADPLLPAASSGVVREAAFGDAVRGGGSPIARYRKGLAPLPGARAEARAIAALWTGPKVVYSGPAATRERAHRLGRSVRYVHFATHALVDYRFPMESALALAPGGSGGGPAEAAGLLPAWDVVDSMHLDADLVTLSGCETALGAAGSGEGLVGLSRAFQIAGARTVAASLWSVSDRSTKELMTRFYRGLARGERKDEALRNAQRALIAGEAGPGFVAPWHWAAFELFGDGR